jgi:DNA invertase Pin-like site-specific DNA recombinase
VTGIAGFVRVSSRAQNAKTQRSAINVAAKARGETIEQWFSETMSGRTMQRPKLDALRSAVRTGTVRRIYSFKIDRFTRTGVADTFALLDEFKRAGCEVVAVADNLHLKPGADDLLTEVFLFALSIAARLERQAINERIAAARDRVEVEGGHWGRPRRMDHAMVDRARTMKKEGRTVRQIAAALKVPRATVQRALSRKPAPCITRQGSRSSPSQHRQQGASQLAATGTAQKCRARP